MFVVNLTLYRTPEPGSSECSKLGIRTLWPQPVQRQIGLPVLYVKLPARKHRPTGYSMQFLNCSQTVAGSHCLSCFLFWLHKRLEDTEDGRWVKLDVYMNLCSCAFYKTCWGQTWMTASCLKKWLTIDNPVSFFLLYSTFIFPPDVFLGILLVWCVHCVRDNIAQHLSARIILLCQSLIWPNGALWCALALGESTINWTSQSSQSQLLSSSSAISTAVVNGLIFASWACYHCKWVGYQQDSVDYGA